MISLLFWTDPAFARIEFLYQARKFPKLSFPRSEAMQKQVQQLSCTAMPVLRLFPQFTSARIVQVPFFTLAQSQTEIRVKLGTKRRYALQKPKNDSNCDTVIGGFRSHILSVV